VNHKWQKANHASLFTNDSLPFTGSSEKPPSRQERQVFYEQMNKTCKNAQIYKTTCVFFCFLGELGVLAVE
jgi:hypothetical protein